MTMWSGNRGRSLKLAILTTLSLVTTGAAIVTGAALGLSFFVDVESQGTAGTWLVYLFIASAVCLAAVVLPAAVYAQREVDRLKRELSLHNPGSDDTPLQASGPLSVSMGPPWLRPLTSIFIEAIKNYREREESLNKRIRDLEIRHRVVETQRRQIEQVLNSLQDGVIVTDSFNEVTIINQAAADMLDINPEQALRQPLDQVVQDERLRRLIRSAQDHTTASDRQYIELELAVYGPRLADGEQDSDDESQDTRTFEVCLSCVENHKREVGGVITILHDITREQELSRMKSEFVSKASHELRTPLSSIRAYVEMLVDGETQDEDSRQEFYRVIQSETNRLSRLIDNMLNISRIEAGIVQIERECVDMKAVIERVIETLEPQAKEKTQTLARKIAPVDLTVQGDSDMLYQVVLNLASNAIKYTLEGGRITIGADTDNLTQSVVVTVSDTGLGIPPDAIGHLFEKFYRVESFKRVAKGTGLGLNLCKHIVETVHHGQIGVESKLGMGSKFWFSVPMRYVGAQQAA